MAKKTTLTVVTPVGTFTRTTARTYTHVVVALGGYIKEYAARYTADDNSHAAENLAYYEAQRAAGVVKGQYDAHTTDEHIAIAKEWIANTPKRHADWLAAGAKTQALGWAGRLDLARKVASDRIANIFNDIKIFEVATGKEVR